MPAIRVVLTAVTLLLAAAPAAAQTFAFTAIPDQDITRLEKRFGRVAEYLEQRLDVPVTYVPVKSYAAAVTAFRNNQVQLAWFGGLSGVRARQLVPGSEAIAQGASDRRFRTYFIANTATGLEKSAQFPADIEGLTFTFGSKGSTSGRLMPEYHLRGELGAPDEVFARVGFSGNHSRTIRLVETGAYQAGALNYKVWETEREAGKIDTDAVQVIWETPPYPDYHWTIRGDVGDTFGDGFAERVRAALLAIDDPVILDAFSRERFVEADNSDYDPILETARDIGLIDE